MPWSRRISAPGQLRFRPPLFMECLVDALAVTPAHPQHVPKSPTIDEGLHVLNAGVMPMIEAVHQPLAALRFDRSNLFDLGCCEGRRFLAENVLTRFEGSYGQRPVQVIGRTNEDGVDGIVLENGLRRIRLRIGNFGSVRIVNRHDPSPSSGLYDLTADPTHLPKSDNTDSDHAHVFILGGKRALIRSTPCDRP